MADIDVSPGILENMHKAIDVNNANKRARNRLIVKAEKGQAGYKDAYEYAGLRGKAAADAIREIEETDLPNGRMYFNIADKSIRPVLEETSDEIFSYASKLLENVNEKAGIHLKPILPDPEETAEKIKGILDLASSNEHWDEVREETAQTVENFSKKCVDDHIWANAERQYEAGLTGKVVRTASRGACVWCEDIAGSYEYAAVKGKGDDVWRRHANCDCVIEYEPVKGKHRTVSSGSYRQNKDSLSPQERERRAEIREQLPDNVTNITREFLKRNQGISTIEFEDGLNTKDSRDEIKIAKWLSETFGGKIVVLKGSSEQLSPDYLWDGKYWDLKTPTGKENAIDQRIRHGIKQIMNNPGGLVIDLSQNKMQDSKKKALEYALKRSQSSIDVIVKDKNNFAVYHIQK